LELRLYGSKKFGALSLAWVAALSLASLPRAVVLVPAGVRLVKAADSLTLGVACPHQQPREQQDTVPITLLPW
jgi:hypothetical protein